ncbi:MAG: family 16 glycosylhydrolase [Flavobacteriales bacterium]
MSIHYLLIFVFAGLAGCDKKTPPAVVLPSNLVTAINVTGGLVDVQASADNANFYTITFYHNNDSTVVETNDGHASYTYTASGNYQVKTCAHTTYTDFIKKTDQITVTIGGTTSGAPTTGYSTPLSYANYSLVWNDEFNGTTLSSDWTFDIGTGSGGWGNNELQYYNNQNYLVDNGYLEITAKNQAFNSQLYTSTRLKTQGIKSWKYGRIDIRAALPYGQGIWPALWMLGDNISTVGWPACGEIDIMELVGGSGANDRTVYGTGHWSDNGTHAQQGGNKVLPSGKFSDEFHVFSIIWNQNSITWLVDDVPYNTLNTTPAGLSEFQEKFFLIFNVAVGGNWPGNPDGTTVFPQTMYVDYVRVFQ